MSHIAPAVRRALSADPDVPVSDVKRRERLAAQAGLLVRQVIRTSQQGDERDAVRRARQVGRDTTLRDGTDYGPGIRIARGEVMRYDRPDIDSKAERKPDIRGARRRDGLLLMWRRGQLGDAQMAAAEAFRDDLAVAAGARMGLPGDAAQVRGKRTNFAPSVAQLDALTRCRKAWDAIGPLRQPIVSWVVISLGTLGGYAQCNHMRPSRAAQRMLKALDLLADFYTANPRA